MSLTDDIWAGVIATAVQTWHETPEEVARRKGVPLIPERRDPPRDLTPNPTIAVCGKCALELKRVMGYCCPHSNCPTGLGSNSTC